MTGKLIVLEGMDGAGTTTQSQRLIQYFSTRGMSARASAEPTTSAMGQEARRLLASPIETNSDLLVSLALCFAADRMQHVHDVIKPSIARGEYVVLDRYVLSSLVYQGLHLPASFVNEINRYAIKPDITVVLDVDARVAHRRLQERGSSKDFYEVLETLHKLKSRYLHFAALDADNTVVIDADQNVDAVHDAIVDVVNERLHG